jgi:hypothetical protein
MDHDCSSPASRRNPERSGLAHGCAPHAFATSTEAGEKYAMTSQYKRFSDSGRVNTAIPGGFPAAAKKGMNRSSISAEGPPAMTPSPRLSAYQLFMIYLKSDTDGLVFCASHINDP